jgi:hypothetical protein
LGNIGIDGMLAFVPPFSDKIRNQCANYVQKSLDEGFFLSFLVWQVIGVFWKCVLQLYNIIFFKMKNIMKISQKYFIKRNVPFE